MPTHQPKRNPMKSLLSWLAALGFVCGQALVAAQPNIVIIFMDDLGYGDLGKPLPDPIPLKIEFPTSD